MSKKVYPPDWPWERSIISDTEVLAIKSVKAGVANPGQQQLAIATIVNKLACTWDMSFRPGPDGDRATVFAEGKRFVGQRIVEILDRVMPVSKEHPNGRPDDTGPEAAGRRNPKPERPRDKPSKPDA